MADNYCQQCGNRLDAGSNFCSKCGSNIKNPSDTNKDEKSPKSAITALLLCLFLGPLGIHRFYVGKVGTGILMLLTGGGFGIWSLIDLIFIACCEFKDSEGRRLIFTRGKGSPLKLALTIIGCLIAAIIVYVIALVILVLYLTSGLSDVARSELYALHDGDFNKAYSYTSQEFQKSTSLDQYKQFVEHYPILKNNKGASFTERKVSDGQGYLRGTLESNDGTKIPIEFILIKENNNWKILGIHLSFGSRSS